MVLFIFIVNSFGIINAKRAPANDFCLNHIYGFEPNLNIQNFVNKYPTVEKWGGLYFQLDISSDLETLNCIGREVESLEQNYKYSVTATSFKLFKLYLLFSNSLIFLFFYNLDKKFDKIFYFLIFLNSVIVSVLFFGKLIFDYQTTSVIFFIFLYRYLNLPNLRREDKVFTIFLFFNVYLLLFDYDLFSKFSVLFLIFFLFLYKNYSLSSYQINLIKFSTVAYYLLRLISGVNRELIQIWETLSNGMYSGSAYFADIFYAFSVLNCKNNSCGSIQNNYGPLFEYFDYSNNLNLSANIFSTFSILFLIFIIIKSFHLTTYNHYVLFLLIASPPLTFVVERMNLDLFVALVSLLSLMLYEKNSKILALFLLSILSQIKIYPIFLIFGVLIYQIFSDNKPGIRSSVIFSLLNFSSLAIYYFLGNISNNVPKPNGVSWTFGIPSHLINYKEIFGANSYIFPSIFIVSINLILLLILKKFFPNILIYNQIFKSNLVFPYLFSFLLISLYYNFDYRAILLIIPSFYLINKKNIETFELLIVIFLMTSVSPFLPELNISITGTINYLFPLIYIMVNHLTFYIILISIAYSTYQKILEVIFLKNKNKL